MKPETTDRILRQPEVLARTGLSGATLRREEAAGRFPQRVQLSRRAVGWPLTAVLEWLRGRARETAE